MRSRPAPSNVPPTSAQMEQRDRFALMASFIRPLIDVIKIGFQAYKQEQTPYNAAFGRNLKLAITGVYPTLNIDYPKFVISKGRLLATPQIGMATTEDAQLDFTWTNNAMAGITNGTDKLTLVVYNPAKQGFVTSVAAALHSANNYDLLLPVL